MKEYLVTYQAMQKSNPSIVAWGDIVIDHQKYFKTTKELDETRKIILEKAKEQGLEFDNVIIINIIKFPIK